MSGPETPLKITALVHFSMPYRNAGSETVLQVLLKYLAGRGHEVECVVTDVGTKPSTVYDGVKIKVVRNVALGIRHVRANRPDLLISHHQHATVCAKLARSLSIPSIFLTHNDMDAAVLPTLRAQPDVIVHNSRWVMDSLNERHGDLIGQTRQWVMHPPLDCERHLTPPAETPPTGITLVNHNADKGGEIFFDLARRMPDRTFYAVDGGHGRQVPRPRDLANVKIIPHGDDMARVWQRTRLLLMPSIYESFGLVGVEAGCVGIPTIAAPTPGLRESLRDAGRFVSARDDLDGWEAQITALDDPDAYVAASEAARSNSADWCESTQHSLLETARKLEALA